jgi:hypothetical protein
MEAISRLPRRLTQLYSDTKTSCDAVVEQDEHDTQSNVLHRKLRIQKDRLIAWGVEWSDNSKGKNGDIDESVEQAGLTKTVTSVLGTIKDILMRPRGRPLTSHVTRTSSRTWLLPSTLSTTSPGHAAPSVAPARMSRLCQNPLALRLPPRCS